MWEEWLCYVLVFNFKFVRFWIEVVFVCVLLCGDEGFDDIFEPGPWIGFYVIACFKKQGVWCILIWW
jgi:hypothetical protein